MSNSADRSHVAANVRAELARRGKRQSDLAAALGISQPALSRRLTGARPFRVDEIQAAARFLTVDTSALIEGPQAAAAS